MEADGFNDHTEVIAKRNSLNETAEKKALLESSRKENIDEFDGDIERYMRSETSSSAIKQAWSNYKRRMLSFARQPREAFMLILPLFYIITFTLILNSFTKGLPEDQ